MSIVREYHDKAMALAERSMMARINGDWDESARLAKEAYLIEAEAAAQVPENPESEPTRSILYRSAATLAFQGRELEMAQRLIAKGLSGYPPEPIMQELKDLYEQVNFENHLKTRGIELTPEDFQIALLGKDVGFGMVIYDEFLKRIKHIGTVLDRIVQRMMGSPYKRAGRVSKNVNPFIPAIAAPSGGSFSFRIKLAIEQGEQMPMFITASQVIGELMDGINMVNENDDKSLKEMISDDSYFRNFVSLTKDIAPDGDKIKLVGFTSNNRTVRFTRKRELIDLPMNIPEERSELTPIEVEGILDFASARKNKEAIGLTTEDGKEYQVMLESGLDDLVRSYFRQAVIVKGMFDKKTIHLIDVQSKP